MDSPLLGNILIIDDTPANLHLLTSILEEKGYEVRAVVSGSMGLVAARTVLPDLILLDIRMPGMDGYEVCEALKADDRLRDIPVIFISSLEDTNDKLKAFHAGGADYITKPFQVEEVVARVESQLARYRLYRHAQELAAVRERQRIARDLHDAVSQTLFSVSMTAETLLYQYQDMPDLIAPNLQQIYRLSQTALAEMRILLLELRPDAILKTHLDDLLRNLATAFQGQAEAEVMLEVQSLDPLPPEVQLTFYRIAQEALHNILKHARASEVIIRLRVHENQVQLRLKDNGRGFEQIPAGRLGLVSMQERAAAVGATCEINSAVGAGTEVRVTWQSGL